MNPGLVLHLPLLPSRKPGDDISPLRLTSSEVLNHSLRFPDKRLIGTIESPAVQPHSIARLNIRHVAQEGVTPPVFFVGDHHPFLPGGDTTCDHYFLVSVVSGRNERNHNNRRNQCRRCNCDQNCHAVIVACPRGDDEAYTENDNKNSTTKMFLGNDLLCLRTDLVAQLRRFRSVRRARSNAVDSSVRRDHGSDQSPAWCANRNANKRPNSAGVE